MDFSQKPRTRCTICKPLYAAMGSFARSAVINIFSENFVGISSRPVCRTPKRSVCPLNCLVLVRKVGIVPNTSREATRPSETTVSLISLMVYRRVTSGWREG